MRSERGLTREALAFRSGITVGSLARIELGQAVPGWDTVRRLATGLDISMVELSAAVEGRCLPTVTFSY
jgi:transcriptional regulator with XRE-family HTH domain